MNSKKGKKPVGTAKKPKPEALMGDLFAAAFKRHKCAAAATIAAVLVLAVIAAWLCGRSGIAEGEAVFYFFNISFNCCHIFMLSVFRRFSLIVVFLLTVCELDKLTSSDRNCGQRILCDHRGNASFLLDQGIQTA